jgi:hypothetical protein
MENMGFELWIFRIVQFMKLLSTISHGLSLPWEIMIVAPIWVEKIWIWFKPRLGESGVHLLIWKITELSSGWTITRTIIGIGAIWT